MLTFALGFVAALAVLAVSFLLVCQNTWKYIHMVKCMDELQDLVKRFIRKSFLTDKWRRFRDKVDFVCKNKTLEKQIEFFEAHKDNWPYQVTLRYEGFFSTHYKEMVRAIRKPDADGSKISNRFFLWVCKDEEEAQAIMDRLNELVFPPKRYLDMSRIHERSWEYLSDLAKGEQQVVAA